MIPLPPKSTLFPYTTLFRSSCIFEHVYFSRPDSLVFGRAVQESREELGRQDRKHTSELQSLRHLVCRLLLEKKKKKKQKQKRRNIQDNDQITAKQTKPKTQI